MSCNHFATMRKMNPKKRQEKALPCLAEKKRNHSLKMSFQIVAKVTLGLPSSKTLPFIVNFMVKSRLMKELSSSILEAHSQFLWRTGLQNGRMEYLMTSSAPCSPQLQTGHTGKQNDLDS